MADGNGTGVYTSRGQVDGEDWAAVAAALNERMAARRVGQQELATLSGVSVSTLRQVQHGAARRVQNKTLAAISRALDWPEGYLADVLLADHHAEPAASQAQDDTVLTVLLRIEERLGEISRRLDALESDRQSSL
jgi:DNA-binding Xre family transcriptional regulator